MFGYNSRYISRYSGKRSNKQQSGKATPRTPPVTPPPGGKGKADNVILQSKSADEVLLKSKKPYYKSILKKPSVDNIDENREDVSTKSALLTAIPEPSSLSPIKATSSLGGGAVGAAGEAAEGSSVEATLQEDGSVEASLSNDPVKSEESENSDHRNNNSFAAAIPWMQQQQPPQIKTSFSGDQHAVGAAVGMQGENPQDGSIPSNLQLEQFLKMRQLSRDSADGDASSISSKSTVSFGKVRVREYERVIDTRMYMGLSLGWAYSESSPKSVDDAIADDADAAGDDASVKSNQSSKTGGSSVGSQASEDDNSQGDGNSKSRKKKPPERFGTFLHYGYSRKQLKQATVDATKYMKQIEKEEKAREALEAKQTRLHATAGGSSNSVSSAKPKKKALLSRSSWM